MTFFSSSLSETSPPVSLLLSSSWQPVKKRLIASAPEHNKAVSFFITQAHDVADCENQHQDNGGHDQRDINVKDPLEFGCTVDNGSFIEVSADAGQSCDVNDGVKAHRLPYGGTDVHSTEIFFTGDEGLDVSAQSDDRGVDDAGRREEHLHNADQDNVRKEVRCVRDSLNSLSCLVAANLVEQQREDQGQREADDQVLKVQQQGVAERTPEVLVRDELVEVPQAAPFITEDAAARAVAAEGDDVARHRDVAENDVVDDGDEQHRVILPVLPDVFCHTALFGRRYGRL